VTECPERYCCWWVVIEIMFPNNMGLYVAVSVALLLKKRFSDEAFYIVGC